MKTLKVIITCLLLTIGSSLAPDIDSILPFSSLIHAITPLTPIPEGQVIFTEGVLNNATLKLDSTKLDVHQLNHLYPELANPHPDHCLELKNKVVRSLIILGTFDSGSPVILTLVELDRRSRFKLGSDIQKGPTDVNVIKQIDTLRQSIKDSALRIRNMTHGEKVCLTGALAHDANTRRICSHNHYSYLKEILRTYDTVGGPHYLLPSACPAIIPIDSAVQVRIMIEISRKRDGSYKARTMNPDVESLVEEINRTILRTTDTEPKTLEWHVSAPTGSVYPNAESLREWITDSVVDDQLFNRGRLSGHMGNIYNFVDNEQKKWENAIEVVEKENRSYEVIVNFPVQPNPGQLNFHTTNALCLVCSGGTAMPSRAILWAHDATPQDQELIYHGTTVGSAMATISYR